MQIKLSKINFIATFLLSTALFINQYDFNQGDDPSNSLSEDSTHTIFERKKSGRIVTLTSAGKQIIFNYKTKLPTIIYQEDTFTYTKNNKSTYLIKNNYDTVATIQLDDKNKYMTYNDTFFREKITKDTWSFRNAENKGVTVGWQKKDGENLLYVQGNTSESYYLAMMALNYALDNKHSDAILILIGALLAASAGVLRAVSSSNSIAIP